MNLRALPAQADHLTTYLEGLEEFLFDPVERRDVSAVASLLAEDFREIGGSGRIYSKLDILAEISSEQPVYITLTDFTCDLVAPGVALVTYKSLSNHDGRPPSQSIRSSVWVQRPVPAFGSTGPGREMRWQMPLPPGYPSLSQTKAVCFSCGVLTYCVLVRDYPLGSTCGRLRARPGA